jgi:hypothetical protein
MNFCPSKSIGMLVWATLFSLTQAAPSFAMPSNYPKLDERKIDTLVFEQGNYDDDAEPEFLIENRWLRLVFEPEHGGTISSVYYKPTQVEFTRKNTAGDWGGLFANVVDSTPAKEDWFQAKFAVQVIKQTPELVSVKLSAKGTTGAYSFATIVRGCAWTT